MRATLDVSMSDISGMFDQQKFGAETINLPCEMYNFWIMRKIILKFAGGSFGFFELTSLSSKSLFEENTFLLSKVEFDIGNA